MESIINCFVCASLLLPNGLQGTQGDFITLEKGFNKRDSSSRMSSEAWVDFFGLVLFIGEKSLKKKTQNFLKVKNHFPLMSRKAFPHTPFPFSLLPSCPLPLSLAHNTSWPQITHPLASSSLVLELEVCHIACEC